MNRIWKLKIPDYHFNDIESGVKIFEIREYNEKHQYDKKYQVNDTIKFINGLDGREIKKKIMYLNYKMTDTRLPFHLTTLGLEGNK